MQSDAFWRETMALAESGRLDEALAAARTRLRIRPRDPASSALLGRLLLAAGRPDQALPQLQRSVELAPRDPAFQNNLGTCLAAVGRHADAVRAFRAALSVDESMVASWVGLAASQFALGQSDDGLESSGRAFALAPAMPPVVLCRFDALLRGRSPAAAVEMCRAHLAAHPGDAVTRSRMLFATNYLDADPAAVASEHREYGARLPAPSPPPARTGPGPLRVGILSSDLRGHSVGFFVDAFLRERPADVEFIVFSCAPAHWEDDFMRHLRGLVQGWHSVDRLDDAALDALIRRERIDVLLELNGHSSHNRLPALARQPAPAVVTMIGYPNTTGLPAVGWRVVDSVTDPPGSEWMCTERLVRLDPCFLCYTPPADAPEPSMPADGEPVTFGSFNNALKVGDRSVQLWSKALHAVPGSRILLKSSGQDGEFMRRGVLARFEANGIAADRVLFESHARGFADHLRLYSRIHVALDTVPYNGTTTTCEALWMGVPVVALLGDRHASRVSASLLRAAGCGEWVASSDGEFAATAARLASDRAGLAALRSGLRGRLRASALLDARAYSARLVDALRLLYSPR